MIYEAKIADTGEESCDSYVKWYLNGDFFRVSLPYISNPNRFSFLGETIDDAIPSSASCYDSPSKCWTPQNGENYTIEVYNSSEVLCKTVSLNLNIAFSIDCAARGSKNRPSIKEPTEANAIFANANFTARFYNPGIVQSGCTLDETYFTFTPTEDGAEEEGVIEIEKVPNNNAGRSIQLPYGGVFDYAAKITYQEDSSYILSPSSVRICVHSSPSEVDFISPIPNKIVGRTVAFKWSEPRVRYTCGDTYTLVYSLYHDGGGASAESRIVSTTATAATYTFSTSYTKVSFWLTVQVKWGDSSATTTETVMEQHTVWFCGDFPENAAFTAATAADNASQLTWSAADFGDCASAGLYAVFVGSGTTFDLYQDNISTPSVTTSGLPPGSYTWYALAYYGHVESGYSKTTPLQTYVKESVLAVPAVLFPASGDALKSTEHPTIRFRWVPLESWGTEPSESAKQFVLVVGGETVGTFPSTVVEYIYPAAAKILSSSSDVTWTVQAKTTTEAQVSAATTFTYCVAAPPTITTPSSVGVVATEGKFVLVAASSSYSKGDCCESSCALVATVVVFSSTYLIPLNGSESEYSFALSEPGVIQYSITLSNGAAASDKHVGEFLVSQCSITMTSPANRATVSSPSVAFAWQTALLSSCSVFVGQTMPPTTEISTAVSPQTYSLPDGGGGGTYFWKVQCGSCESGVWSFFSSSCSGSAIFPELISPADGAELTTSPPYILEFTASWFAGCSFADSVVMFALFDGEKLPFAASSDPSYYINVPTAAVGLHAWHICFAASLDSPLPLCGPDQVFSSCSVVRTAPLLIAPLNNAAIATLPVTLTWSPAESPCAVDYFSLQRLEIIGPLTTTAHTLEAGVATFAYYHESAYVGPLSWRVVTILPYGAEISSEIWNLTNCVTEMSPPTPKESSAGTNKVTLSWVSSTTGLCPFVLNNLKYEIMFLQNNEENYSARVSSTTYTGTGGATSSAFLTWKVAMVANVPDDEGTTSTITLRSAYSPEQVAFLCLRSPPPAVEYVSPGDGFVTKNEANTVFEFSWKQSFFGTKCTEESEDGDMFYVFNLDGEEEAKIKIAMSEINPNAKYYYSPSVPFTSGEHTWSVDKVFDDMITKGTAQTFTLCVGTIPPAPELLSPQDTFATVPDYPFMLQWSTGSCGAGCPWGSCSGEVFMGTATDTGTMASYGVSGGGQLRVDDVDGDYYWTVRLDNNYGVGPFATPKRIRICNPQKPDPPNSISLGSSSYTLGGTSVSPFKVTFSHSGSWGSSCYAKQDLQFVLSFTNAYTGTAVKTARTILSTEAKEFTIDPITDLQEVGKVMIGVGAINTDGVRADSYVVFIVCSPLTCPTPLTPGVGALGQTIAIPFAWSAMSLNEIGYSCSENPFPELRVYLSGDSLRREETGAKVLAGTTETKNTDLISLIDRLPTATPFAWWLQVFISSSENAESAKQPFTTKDIDCTNKGCSESTSECAETATGADCECAVGWEGDLCTSYSSTKAVLIVLAVVLPVVVIVVIVICVFLFRRSRRGLTFAFSQKNIQSYRFERFSTSSSGSSTESEKVASLLSLDHQYNFVKSISLIKAHHADYDGICKALFYAWMQKGYAVEFAMAIIEGEMHTKETESVGLFTTNTPAIKVFYYFVRAYGLDYLWGSLRNTLEHILRKEIKKRKIVITVADKSRSRVVATANEISLESYGRSTDSNANAIWENEDTSADLDYLSMQLDAQVLFDAIIRSEKNVPDELCKLLSEIKCAFITAFPESFVSLPLSSIFLQRFVLASIVSTRSFFVFDEVPRELRSYLVKISKFIHSAGTMLPVGDEQMKAYTSAFVDDNADILQVFLIKLCSRGENISLSPSEVPSNIYDDAIRVLNSEVELDFNSSSSTSSSAMFSSQNSPKTVNNIRPPSCHVPLSGGYNSGERPLPPNVPPRGANKNSGRTNNPPVPQRR
jgi:hypothetical protein